MAKLTWISVWFDDGTRFDIEPDRIRSIFTSQGSGAKCGHHGPYQTPGPHSPVKGPFPDSNPPHPQGGGNGDAPDSSAAALTTEGSCYFVNGVVICP